MAREKNLQGSRDCVGKEKGRGYRISYNGLGDRSGLKQEREFIGSCNKQLIRSQGLERNTLFSLHDC